MSREQFDRLQGNTDIPVVCIAKPINRLQSIHQHVFRLLGILSPDRHAVRTGAGAKKVP